MKKLWTWEDHDIHGRGRNVIKDTGRSLSFGDVTVIMSVPRKGFFGEGSEAFDLIPKMAKALNDAGVGSPHRTFGGPKGE